MERPRIIIVREEERGDALRRETGCASRFFEGFLTVLILATLIISVVNAVWNAASSPALQLFIQRIAP